MHKILSTKESESACHKESASESAYLSIRDNISHHLFSCLDTQANGFINKNDLLNALRGKGIPIDDPRMKVFRERLDEFADKDLQSKKRTISSSDFDFLIQDNFILIQNILEGNLVIPDFERFKELISEIYRDAKANTDGKVASYIPELASVAPDLYAASVCTISGQRFSLGDSKVKFGIQSASKPFTYAIALEENGVDEVHRHIGREPSGVGFNATFLNKAGLPHNPLINAGAIMSCSLIKPSETPAERLNHVLETFRQLSGSVERPEVDVPMFLSEKDTAYTNKQLGYLMLGKGAFQSDDERTMLTNLDFYFQTCSIQMTTEKMAVIAGTLAHGGICPITGQRVLKPETVQHVLTLMSTCGMYDYSGEFAFKIGLPAKSGVSGVVITVVPNVMGLATFSPRLDELGNSARGIEFAEALVDRFNFHNYDNLTVSDKDDPRMKRNESTVNKLVSLCFAAAQGSLQEVQTILAANGININEGDYDGRTPLHIAASEGHDTIVSYFLTHGATPNPVDRWGNTPLDDAIREKAEDVQATLRQHGGKDGNTLKQSVALSDVSLVLEASQPSSHKHQYDTGQVRSQPNQKKQPALITQ